MSSDRDDADIGRHVIAIEALPQIRTHLCTGVAKNMFADKITIIHYALSSNHDDFKLVLPTNEDFGISFVEQGNIRADMSKIWGFL